MLLPALLTAQLPGWLAAPTCQCVKLLMLPELGPFLSTLGESSSSEVNLLQDGIFSPLAACGGRTGFSQWLNHLRQQHLRMAEGC